MVYATLKNKKGLWVVTRDGSPVGRVHTSEYRALRDVEACNAVEGMQGPRKSDFVCARAGYPEFAGRNDVNYCDAIMSLAEEREALQRRENRRRASRALAWGAL